MLVGYMRVSKADGSQVLDLQRDALLEAGVSPDKIWEDMSSGAKDDRPGLAGCIKSLNKGDVLAVWKLDRLGRNLKHLIATVEDLDRRGVRLQGLARRAHRYVNADRKVHLSALCRLGRIRARHNTRASRGWLEGGASKRARGRAQVQDHAFNDPSRSSRDAESGYERHGLV